MRPIRPEDQMGKPSRERTDIERELHTEMVGVITDAGGDATWAADMLINGTVVVHPQETNNLREVLENLRREVSEDYTPNLAVEAIEARAAAAQQALEAMTHQRDAAWADWTRDASALERARDELDRVRDQIAAARKESDDLRSELLGVQREMSQYAAERIRCPYGKASHVACDCNPMDEVHLLRAKVARLESQAESEQS